MLRTAAAATEMVEFCCCCCCRWLMIMFFFSLWLTLAKWQPPREIWEYALNFRAVTEKESERVTAIIRQRRRSEGGLLDGQCKAFDSSLRRDVEKKDQAHQKKKKKENNQPTTTTVTMKATTATTKSFPLLTQTPTTDARVLIFRAQWCRQAQFSSASKCLKVTPFSLSSPCSWSCLCCSITTHSHHHTVIPVRQ